jgi:hypothetical protein
MAVLMTAVAQILVMEEALGLTDGHAEMRALVERYLARDEDAANRPASERERHSRHE